MALRQHGMRPWGKRATVVDTPPRFETASLLTGGLQDNSRYKLLKTHDIPRVLRNRCRQVLQKAPAADSTPAGAWTMKQYDEAGFLCFRQAEGRVEKFYT
jgi:hypothetical protein